MRNRWSLDTAPDGTRKADSLSLPTRSPPLEPIVAVVTGEPIGPSVSPDGSNPTKQSSASIDRKSTRLNSSHGYISYAVFCLKKKKIVQRRLRTAFDQGQRRP